MELLKFFKVKNLIQIYTKTHQIAPFLKIFSGGGGMPPNPPNKAHGFAMHSMSLCDMQISKSPKKFLGPPLPNPGDAPDWYPLLINKLFMFFITQYMQQYSHSKSDVQYH